MLGFGTKSVVTMRLKWVISLGTISVLIIALIWVHLVFSYESPLGTDNTFQAEPLQASSSDNDSLIKMDMSGSENLLWSKMSVELEIVGQSYFCSTSGLSSSSSVGKVDMELSADGYSFIVTVDAQNDEDPTLFNFSSIEEMSSGDWISFAHTIISIADSQRATWIDGADFDEVDQIPDEWSFSGGEELDWYDYDMSTHRVEPKNGVFVIDDGESVYKVQFLSYYNEDDDSRFITFQLALLDGENMMIFQDLERMEPSACIIIDDDEQWNLSESITIVENGFNLCSENCTVSIYITYEGVVMTGTEKVILVETSA